MSSMHDIDRTVAHEWQRRPDDERFLTMEALHAFVAGQRARCHQQVVRLDRLQCRAAEDGDLLFGLGGVLASPTEWAFDQICSTARLDGPDGGVGLPRAFLKALPTEKAAELTRYVLGRSQQEAMLYVADGAQPKLRAVTGPRYGRIHDADVVEAVMRATRHGDWKVPGSSVAGPHGYDPHAPVTRESTTLFAGDRDIFLFLCQDTRPIMVGTMPDGRPDLMFRGFYVRNSEVGASTYEVSSMYLRAVCANRILWGVENKRSIRIRHNRMAPQRFIEEAIGHLDDFCMDDDTVRAGVAATKQRILAEDEAQMLFRFRVAGIGAEDAAIAAHAFRILEEREVRSAWDFAQAITMLAHLVPNADAKLSYSRIAARFLD